MFDLLTNSFGKIFAKMRAKGLLTEEDVNSAAREVRIALIEADVALPVIKYLIDRIKIKALGTEVLSSIKPGQMVAKIVCDEIAEMLQSDNQELQLNYPSPVVMLLVGLQGAGKTTTAAKIALRLRQKSKKKVLLASLDVKRPAAQKQLEVLGKQIDVETLPIIHEQSVTEIVLRSLSEAKLGNFDVLILDSAGRTSVDIELMQELQEVQEKANPRETLLVTDCMIGQAALGIAESFLEKVSITGVVLTKIDGDARGGAALSMKFVTGCPIKLVGTGEKLSDLEEFKPESIASRILGMGDVVALVEKMSEIVDLERSEDLLKKVQKGQFDLNDLLAQIKNMKKLGGMTSLLGMIPGFGKIKATADVLQSSENLIGKQQAIIYSMTAKERRNPSIINPSRKHRIAFGSGTSVADVNRLLKQYLEMNKVMKRVSKMDASAIRKLGARFMG